MTDGSPSIALYRERSVTDVINATFQFLRNQFGPLVKGLLFLAGPALIIANVVALFATGPQGTARPLLLFAQLGLTLIGSVIAMAVVIGAVQIAHVEGPSALTTQRLWTTVRTHGLALFGRQLQIGAIIAFGGLLTGIAVGGIAGGIGLYAGGSAIFAFILGGLVFLLFLGFLFYVGPTFMLLFPGQVDEERSISLTRCVQLVKGRWGQTLGVWLLATIITMVLFSVGWLPRFLLNLLATVGSNPSGTAGLVLAGSVAGVANTLAPAVTYTAITLQYYNLIEQKEQVSLQEEVGRMEQEAAHSTADSSAEITQTTATADRDSDAESETHESERASPDVGSDDDRRWKGTEPSE